MKVRVFQGTPHRRQRHSLSFVLTAVQPKVDMAWQFVVGERA